MSVRIATVLLVGIPLVACATKRDLQELRTEVEELRETQAETLAALREQQERGLRLMEEQDARLRGELSTRFVEIEQQLVQIQELTGQSQHRIAELRDQLAERATPVSPGRELGQILGDEEPDELYEASLATLRRGSPATARAGFEEFLSRFPDHHLAPDARFYIAEAHAEAGDAERALDAYARVLEDHPASARVPTALYRAGMIELERGNQEEARALFRQVVSGYPDSPEASLARQRLERR